MRRGDDLRHAAAVFLHEALRVVVGILNALDVASRCAIPVVHRAREHKTDAKVVRGLDDGFVARRTLVVQIKEIADGRDAAFHHLSKGEQCARIDVAAAHFRRILVE